MAQIVIMPKEGITVESCIFGNWRKEIGDPVAINEALFDYETDKATFECVSTASGILLHKFYAAGDEAPVLRPVAIIGEAGEDIAMLIAGVEAEAESRAAHGKGDAAQSDGETEDDNAAGAQAAPPSDAVDVAKAAPGQLNASPRARNFAAERGVDLRAAAPTGPGGRILEADVIAAANAAQAAEQAENAGGAKAEQVPEAQAVPATPVPQAAAPDAQAVPGPAVQASQAPSPDTIPTAPPAPVPPVPPAPQAPQAVSVPPAPSAPDTQAAPAPPADTIPTTPPADTIPPVPPAPQALQAASIPQAPPAPVPPAPHVEPVPERKYADEAFSNIRAVIAKTMKASLDRSAQLTHHHSFDATSILAMREEFKKTDETLGYRNVSVGDIILYITSRVLAKHPEINALVADEGVRKYFTVNLGVAVDTPRGLLVPTVFSAEKKSLREISGEVKALAAAAKEGRINPDRLTGGTFTVSNLGATGVEIFTPIINPPQAAILGICGVTERVRLGKDRTPEVYPAIGLSFTYDHSAVDGAPASRFVAEICDALVAFSWKTLALEPERSDF